MVSIESKEAAITITDLIEVISKFDNALNNPNLYNELTGRSELGLQYNSDEDNNFYKTSSNSKTNRFNNKEEEKDYENLTTSEIISKFKSQVKQYEKQNEYLKNKLDSMQLQQPKPPTKKYSNESVKL